MGQLADLNIDCVLGNNCISVKFPKSDHFTVEGNVFAVERHNNKFKGCRVMKAVIYSQIFLPKLLLLLPPLIIIINKCESMLIGQCR